MLISLKITTKVEGAFSVRELKLGNGRNSALVDVGEVVHAILTTYKGAGSNPAAVSVCFLLLFIFA